MKKQHAYLVKDRTYMSRVITKRDYYKPLEYPWAYEAYKIQNQIHWLPEEVSLREDINDWNNKLTDKERQFLTNIFRFFTQGDISVAKGYLHRYIPVFGHKPELAMMMSAFANMEAVHIDAYSLLLDTVGMPEVEYQMFTEYEEMRDKHEELEKMLDITGKSMYDIRNIATSIAVYSAFTEGLQLFSSFAMLLNFPRFNKMKGMGQIVTWSIRDEGLHVESMLKLFETIINENPKVWTDKFKATLYETCRKFVHLEDKFIERAFSLGDMEGLTEIEVKNYIRYIADRRLLQLGLKTNYGVKHNPLPWLDEILNSVEHSNFFETRSTEYSRAVVKGWDTVWGTN